MRYGIFIAVSVVVSALTSCGGSSDVGGLAGLDGGGGEGGISADRACADVATAYCKRVDACAPLFISLVWGDEVTCAARVAPSCTKGLAASATGATPEGYEACAVDVEATDCTSLLSRKLPASCRPSGGQVSSGGVCGDDWQCQSGFCSIAGGQACGTCATRQAAGGTCTDDAQCEFGLNCAGATGSKVCVALGTMGATCDDNHPCASPNVCIGRTATASGTCGAGAPPGGACAASGCDFAQALFCHPITRVCQKISFAMPGEQCGVLNNGLVACTGSMCTPPSQPVGTCGAIADDGGACDDTNGPKCKAGAKCIGGTCQVSDPSACK